VRSAGHPEQDIIEELIRIKNGESWVGFSNLPSQYKAKTSEKLKKKVSMAPDVEN
jgi:hypothetical protein